MAIRLIESLAASEPLAEVFSDPSVLAAMLEFEVALARAEARLKIIPRAAAETIATWASPKNFKIACWLRRKKALPANRAAERSNACPS